WDETAKVGIATELNRSEAYRSLIMIQRMVWMMVGIIFVGMIIVLVLRELRARSVKLNFALQRESQARKEMLAMVSHDLKNPLSALMMTNDILIKSLPQNSEFTDKRRALLERSRHAAQRMERLIVDI